MLILVLDPPFTHLTICHTDSIITFYSRSTQAIYSSGFTAFLLSQYRGVCAWRALRSSSGCRQPGFYHCMRGRHRYMPTLGLLLERDLDGLARTRGLSPQTASLLDAGNGNRSLGEFVLPFNVTSA